MVVGLFAKRIRHVLLLLASLASVAAVVAFITYVELFDSRILRPRPIGMTKIGDWDGFAQPSRVSGLLAVVLVAVGLTLIPRGAWRRTWWITAVGVFVVFGYAQLYTGVEHPSDIIAGVTVGVAFTLVLFRLGAPEEVFPIQYRQGNTAHLDVTGPRGDAIRLGLERQLGVHVVDIKPVGLEGSAGRLRCSSPSSQRRAALQSYSRNCTQGATSGPTAPTSCFARSSTVGSRTRPASRRSGGWCSTRTTCST